MAKSKISASSADPAASCPSCSPFLDDSTYRQAVAWQQNRFRGEGLDRGSAAVPPYLNQQAVYVGIVDVAWNGILEFRQDRRHGGCLWANVAPHNFNRHLGALMSGHLCAATSNRMSTIDIEDVPWKDDRVSKPSVIEAVELLRPT